MRSGASWSTSGRCTTSSVTAATKWRSGISKSGTNPTRPFYWQGTPQDFYKLHDVAIAAVRRALPVARVGGPDVAGAGGAFMDGFLEACVVGKELRDR